MTRAKSGKISKNRHKKILKLAKGYQGRASTCFRVAIERVEKALSYAYRDRRNKKRDFRGLWIQRINAACREQGVRYSELINAMKKADMIVDRKVLAELAVSEPQAFSEIIKQAKPTKQA